MKLRERDRVKGGNERNENERIQIRFFLSFRHYSLEIFKKNTNYFAFV
jgi:hypothetical protein